ncbi:hypothetical protein ACFO0S_03550 [Chryseomicrobium palamuruense]|uniref:Lipoprotein n=1 Tax=Chryseomicrobium palamuruense TaxID=682973 RepID=A0ABV8UUK3_9BACL
MKKSLTVGLAASALLLGACNMDQSIPDNNETPMEDVREDAQEMVPDVTPPETNGNGNGNDTRDNRNDVAPSSQDKNTDTDKDMMKDPNTNEEEVIEDDIDRKDPDNKDE